MYVTRYMISYPINREYELLLNTLSGAVDIVTRKECEDIERIRNGGSVNDESLLNQLKDRKYIFEDHQEEQELLNKIFGVCSQFDAGSIDYIICPTYRCNLACRYCFERDLISAKSATMTQKVVENVLKAISAIGNIHSERTRSRITLFGGEPLLNMKTRRIIKKVFQEAENTSQSVSIVTNGVNLRKHMDILNRYKDSIERIQVTVDGPKHIHDRRRVFPSGKGSFDEIIEGIESAFEAGFPLHLRVNVDAENLEFVPDLGEFIISKGWNDSNQFVADIAPVTDHLCSNTIPNLLPEHEIVGKTLRLLDTHPEHMRVFRLRTFRILNHIARVFGFLTDNVEFEDIPSFYYCETNYMPYYVFGAEGLIYPCSECIGKENFAIGRAHPDFFLDEGKEAGWKNRNVLTIPRCRECVYLTLCGGGCAFSSLANNGSLYIPMCEDPEKVLFSFLDFMNRKGTLEQFIKTDNG
jgi:uncharacterized protein